MRRRKPCEFDYSLLFYLCSARVSDANFTKFMQRLKSTNFKIVDYGKIVLGPGPEFTKTIATHMGINLLEERFRELAIFSETTLQENLHKQAQQKTLDYLQEDPFLAQAVKAIHEFSVDHYQPLNAATIATKKSELFNEIKIDDFLAKGDFAKVPGFTTISRENNQETYLETGQKILKGYVEKLLQDHIYMKLAALAKARIQRTLTGYNCLHAAAVIESSELMISQDDRKMPPQAFVETINDRLINAAKAEVIRSRQNNILNIGVELALALGVAGVAVGLLSKFTPNMIGNIAIGSICAISAITMCCNTYHGVKVDIHHGVQNRILDLSLINNLGSQGM
jgi:hypothetical protein